jgi:tetratricopeptide (TPR) repeat protein
MIRSISPLLLSLLLADPAPAAPPAAGAASQQAADFLPVLEAAVTAASSPEADFQAGERAMAAKDYAAALPRLEAALAADPDSLRYASEYRMAVIAGRAYDRALDVFKRLVAAHPQSAAAELNYGYAYVDKIPAAGSITQVILANDALKRFTRSIELKPTWLALFTRGNSYLYWPKVFGRTPLGIADLEAAVRMSRAGPQRPYHARAWVSLGDAHWKLDEIDKARATWSEALKLFPGNAELEARLARQGDELKEYIESELDPNQRVDTDLKLVWSEP